MRYPIPRFGGDGFDILLQGFHWESHLGDPGQNGHGEKTWFRIVKENAAVIRSAGFSWVWLPPCSDSLAPQGYIPRRWFDFDTAYGSEHELRALLHELGPVKAMADVVLNHRVGVHTAGADFDEPAFPDNRAAIASDDESGVGTGAPDTGERHPCGRDLDHTNAGMRWTAKQYLQRLRGMGFQGFRYDLVKGFGPGFIGEYNDTATPKLSVGECFETDRHAVARWMDGTGGKSSAFDFPTRYALWSACNSNDFHNLRHGDGAAGLIGLRPERSVTFVDNHDTEWRRESEHQANYDATRHFPGAAAEMAYAYTMTHPGIPCVFWAHFFDWGVAARRRIEQLMALRREQGLHAACRLRILEARHGLYAAVAEGRVAVKLGWGEWRPPGPGWSERVRGERFTVWAR